MAATAAAECLASFICSYCVTLCLLKMFPTVSVIIPNYNHAPYLRQRIDSVLKQDYQDFEVILLDDCSKDDSRQVLDSYRNHPKVSHVVYNEQNTGNTFIQWERGVNLAQGRYIWIAESDDVAELSLIHI